MLEISIQKIGREMRQYTIDSKAEQGDVFLLNATVTNPLERPLREAHVDLSASRMLVDWIKEGKAPLALPSEIRSRASDDARLFRAFTGRLLANDLLPVSVELFVSLVWYKHVLWGELDRMRPLTCEVRAFSDERAIAKSTFDLKCRLSDLQELRVGRPLVLDSSTLTWTSQTTPPSCTNFTDSAKFDMVCDLSGYATNTVHEYVGRYRDRATDRIYNVLRHPSRAECWAYQEVFDVEPAGPLVTFTR